ncbi:MAG: VOC family protein [Pseudomonadota bacterium]
MMKVQASAPHFFVSNLMRSVRFYVDMLGFREPNIWGEPPCFAMPDHGGFVVMLNQAEGKPPAPNGPDCWDAYFWCDAIDELHEQLVRAGARLAHGPEEREYYGMRELAVLDPDGYLLVFAEDMPAEAEKNA